MRRVSAGEPGAAYCRGSAFGGRLPCVGTGRPAADRENRPPLRVPRSLGTAQGPLFHARHPSPPTGNAAVSGAHTETSVSVLAPLAGPPPGGGVSEGARHCGTLASLFLRLSDKRRPTVPLAAGPERADEGGGARRRGGSKRAERNHAVTLKWREKHGPVQRRDEGADRQDRVLRPGSRRQ